MTADFLILQNVGLRLGRSPRFLLEDISLELRAGEVTTLLGHRGSGKTLLLKLLNGLISPSQGQILWQEQALETQSPIKLRRQIAWLPQQPRLLGMTGKEAIAYPLQLQGFSPTQIQQRMDTWLEMLGLPLAWLEQRETALTQSAAQGIALARAFVMEPQLLLLDNPWPQPLESAIHGPTTELSNLSESNALPPWDNPQARLEQALSQLTRQGGAVIWAMTAQNQPPAAAEHSQRLLCLNRGKLRGDSPMTPENWGKALEYFAQNSPHQQPDFDDEAWD